MASRTTSRKRRAKAPQPSFAKKRGLELLGMAMLFAVVFFTFSLLSYHSSDPSLNHVGQASGPIKNIGGIAGAYASDVLLQLHGIASVVALLILTAWGWRLVTKRHLRGWWLRITATMIAMIAASALFSFIIPPASWPLATGLGGALGMVVSDQLSLAFTPLIGGLMLAVLLVMALPFAFGLKRSEWLAMYVMCYDVLRRIGQVMRYMLAAFHGTADGVMNTARDAAPHGVMKKLVFWRQKEMEEEAAHVEAVQEKKVKAKAKRVPKKKREEVDEEIGQSSMELRPRQGNFALPSFDHLQKTPPVKKASVVSESALQQNAKLLESVLADFGVKGEIVAVRPGPVVTLYELEPAAGTKSSRVIGLADDIARSMSSISARISVIPGKNALGIELPNSSRETVYLRELLEHRSFKNTDAKLPLILGKDIGGEPIIADLAKMPHLLVAGTTGSGKSVGINTMLMSLVYHMSPEQCRLILIDPKMLELSVYDNIPHLLSPVVTEPGKAVVALKWAVKEMENRYRLMSNLGVRNIENYNKRIAEAARKGEELTRTVQTGFDVETGKPTMEKVPLDMNPLPFIVVVVDEMADLMLVAGKDIEGSIQRLAQMARAAGIHIIMATQRPSVDVITGVIKANFPTRISFQVTSKIDSRTILGEQGAEQLLGLGDQLYMAGGGRVTRVHGPFVADSEVESVVSYLRTQGEPNYEEAVTVDDEEEANFDAMMNGGEMDEETQLYMQAKQIVMQDRKASTSYIQRKLKIGYNRAARLIDQMEDEGIVGPANHVGKREILLRPGE